MNLLTVNPESRSDKTLDLTVEKEEIFRRAKKRAGEISPELTIPPDSVIYSHHSWTTDALLNALSYRFKDYLATEALKYAIEDKRTSITEDDVVKAYRSLIDKIKQQS